MSKDLPPFAEKVLKENCSRKCRVFLPSKLVATLIYAILKKQSLDAQKLACSLHSQEILKK